MPESFANDQPLTRKEFGGSVGSVELRFQFHDQPRWMRAEALIVAWRLCRRWHFSASYGERDDEQKAKKFHSSENWFCVMPVASESGGTGERRDRTRLF